MKYYGALLIFANLSFRGPMCCPASCWGIEWGTLTLVVNGDVVAGTIRTPEASYRIRPAGPGLHTVSQIDPSQLPPIRHQPRGLTFLYVANTVWSAATPTSSRRRSEAA